MSHWIELFLALAAGTAFGFALCALMTQAKVDALVAELAHHIQTYKCPKCEERARIQAEFQADSV